MPSGAVGRLEISNQVEAGNTPRCVGRSAMCCVIAAPVLLPSSTLKPTIQRETYSGWPATGTLG
jgi:hypothetical protein